MGWIPDEIFYATKAAKGGGKGGGKGNWMQNQQQAAQAVPDDQSAFLAQMLSLLVQNPMAQGHAGSSSRQRGAPGPPWKERLHAALHKTGVDFGPSYVTMPNPAGEGWMASLTLMGQAITSAEAGFSKKDAEQLAAKAALQTLFPDVFNELPASERGANPRAMTGMSFGGRSGQGQKRKGPTVNTQFEQCMKSKLMLGVQALVRNTCNRDMLKDDLVYELTENQGPPYTCMSTVTIKGYGQSFGGEWSKTLSEAENSAAQAAWNVCGEMLGTLQEAASARKKAKRDADRAAYEAKKLLAAQAESAGMA